MKTLQNRNRDLAGAFLFALLTIIFVLLMVFNSEFSDWSWDRHHNVLSWYIRPLALLPFIFFAYKHSLTGMSFSIFVIATSMAWFPAPATPDPAIAELLNTELEFLTSNWTVTKVLGSMIVPVIFVLLAVAFWNRSFVYGALVLVASSVFKVSWGVIESGQSGWSLLPPAVTGLAVTLALLYVARWWQSRTQPNSPTA